MKHSRKFCISFLCCVLLFVASCSGLRPVSNGGTTATNSVSSSNSFSPTKSETKSPHDVCSLITKEEIDAVLGDTVSHTEGDENQCFYFMEHNGRPMVLVYWGMGETGYKIAQSGGSTMSKSVSGIGDEASYAFYGTLTFRKGKDVVIVDLRGFKDAEEKTKTLAQKAIAKL
jgi:hypothetical protein